MWETTITSLTGSTTGKITHLKHEIKDKFSLSVNMELIDHLGYTSPMFIPAASTPPKVRTLAVPSPLESNWLAARYNHTFITLLYDLIVLKGISYNLTSL